MKSDFVADLSHNALIAVTGDDATAFLHAQFTNDVEALHAGEAQWNGWCSPKGRLLATFLLLRRTDGYLLMLPAEIAQPIARRLAMFVLRSKVKIQDVSELFARVGIAGERAAALVAGHWGSAPAPMRSVEKSGAICGGLKRRMALTHLAGHERPAPGQSVYSSAFGDQAAGTIVNAAPAPEGGFDALVVAQLESLAQGDLRWKSPDGPPLEIRLQPPAN